MRETKICLISTLRKSLIEVIAVPPISAYILRAQRIIEVTIDGITEDFLPAIPKVVGILGVEACKISGLSLRIAIAPHPFLSFEIIEAI